MVQDETSLQGEGDEGEMPADPLFPGGRNGEKGGSPIKRVSGSPVRGRSIQYRVCRDVVHKARGSWHLFFRPQTLRWAVTDGVGREILEALRALKTPAQAGQEIAARLGLSYPEVAAEVARFIRSVSKAGLVEPGEGAPPEQGRATDERTPRPGSLYLHLTERCHLACVYCYARPQRGRGHGPGKDLPPAVAKLALSEAKALGVKDVIVTGGEPLVHLQALDVLEKAAEMGFHVALLTNAVLIDRELAQRLASCCHEITVSLDSASPTLHDLQRGQGTHARVAQAIALLKAAGVREVVGAGVLTRHNQHERHADFAGYAKKAGADRAVRQVYILQGDGRDDALCPDFEGLLSRWEQELEDTIAQGLGPAEGASLNWRDRCGAASGVVAVGADGAVYPCQGLMRPEFAAGRIKDSSLEAIYTGSEVMRRVRDITVEDIPGCGTCMYRFICGGGCRALAYNATGSIAAPIPPEYCAFARLLAEWKLWSVALHGLTSPAPAELSL